MYFCLSDITRLNQNCELSRTIFVCPNAKAMSSSLAYLSVTSWTPVSWFYKGNAVIVIFLRHCVFQCHWKKRQMLNSVYKITSDSLKPETMLLRLDTLLSVKFISNLKFILCEDKCSPEAKKEVICYVQINPPPNALKPSSSFLWSLMGLRWQSEKDLSKQDQLHRSSLHRTALNKPEPRIIIYTRHINYYYRTTWIK